MSTININDLLKQSIQKDVGQDMSLESEPIKLTGDADKLSEATRKVVEDVDEAILYRHVKLKKIAESFSGSLVLFFTPIQKDGSCLASSILKIDTAENIEEEAELTKKYAPLFGAAVPKIQQTFLNKNEKVGRESEISS